MVPRPLLLDVARRRALELAEAQGAGRALRPEASVGSNFTAKALTTAALEENPLGRKVLFHQARKTLLAKTRGHYPAPERALEVVRIGLDEGAPKGYEAEARCFGELRGRQPRRGG